MMTIQPDRPPMAKIASAVLRWYDRHVLALKAFGYVSLAANLYVQPIRLICEAGRGGLATQLAVASAPVWEKAMKVSSVVDVATALK